MSIVRDPFEVLVVEEEATTFDALARKPVAAPAAGSLPIAVTARLHAFDLSDRPLVVGVPDLPHEIVVARTTVPLMRNHVGSTVVLVFEQGDPRRPIIIGVTDRELAATQIR